jgi:hypothetical protein
MAAKPPPRDPSIPPPGAATCLHCGAAHDASAVRCPTTGRALGGDPRLIGQLIDKRYRIVRLLGGGPMGSAYKAEHVALGRAVALRVLPASLIGSPHALHRFFQEARLMSSVASPRLQQLLYAGLSQEGVAYVAYGYVRGRSLAQALYKDAPMPLQRAATIVCDVLEGLSAIHTSGFVHRALGPESVLLQPSDTGAERAILTNFGAAALELERYRNDPVGLSRELAAGPRVVVPTPYVPPEREKGEPPDLREDIFCAGVMLSAMLSPGGMPRFGSDLLALGAPPGIEAIVARAAHPLRGARFGTANDMRTALLPHASVEAAEPVTATATHISDLRTLSLRERVMRNDRQRQSLTIPLDNAPLVDAKVGTALLAALRDASGPGWQEVVRRIPLAGMFLEADATSPVPSTVIASALEEADAIAGTNDRLFCCVVGQEAAAGALGDAILAQERFTPELFFDQEAGRLLESFGGGASRATQVGRGYGRIEIRNQRRPRLALCSCVTVLLSQLLARTGARDVELNKTACEAVGDPACIYTATWL